MVDCFQVHVQVNKVLMASGSVDVGVSGYEVSVGVLEYEVFVAALDVLLGLSSPYWTVHPSSHGDKALPS